MIRKIKNGDYNTLKSGIKRIKKKYYNNLENIIRKTEKRSNGVIKKYNQKNKERLLRWRGEWRKYKRRTDPKYRLNENMGSAISRSLKNRKGRRIWEILVSYTLEDLMEHLEKQFGSKMNWDNYGSYWAVDHLKPRSLFNYTSPNGLEFKQCWALENLQPLEKIKNIKKGNHLPNF